MGPSILLTANESDSNQTFTSPMMTTLNRPSTGQPIVMSLNNEQVPSDASAQNISLNLPFLTDLDRFPEMLHLLQGRTGTASTLPYNHSNQQLLDTADSLYDNNYNNSFDILWNSMPSGSTPSKLGGLYPNTPYDIAGIYFHTPEEMLIPWVVNPYFYPILITYVITFFVGVTGNILVIWLMLGNKDNRNVTTLFLVSLSVSDLLLLIVYAPLELINLFVLHWDREGTICRLSAYAEAVSAFGSVLNLVAVTLERFVVIVFPIKSRTICAMHNCKRVLALVWILALILAIPMIFIKTTIKMTYTNYETTVTVYYCKEKNDLTAFSIFVYRFVLLFAIPSIIMIACYTWVIIELWISTKHMDEAPSVNTFKSSSMGDLNKSMMDSRTGALNGQPSSLETPGHVSSISMTTASANGRTPMTMGTSQRVMLRSHVRRETSDVKAARKQVIKMLILIVLLFLGCWGPRVSFDLIIKCCLDSYDHANYFLKFLFSLLPFVHSCLNPIVYCLMSSKFRCQLVQLVRRMFGRPCCPTRHDSLTGQSIVLRRQPYHSGSGGTGAGGGVGVSSRRTTIASEPITSRAVTNDTCVE